MKHLIITGFTPFGGEAINPSWEAVKRLPDTVGNYRLTKIQIPTVFVTAAETILAASKADPADVILCVGQAGGRSAVTPERIAVNMMDARISDNRGNSPKETPCIPGGPDGIFSTVPVRAMADAIAAAGLPGQVSNTAGTFVCNDTLYRLVYHFRDSGTRVGFLHGPGGYRPGIGSGHFSAQLICTKIRLYFWYFRFWILLAKFFPKLYNEKKRFPPSTRKRISPGGRLAERVFLFDLMEVFENV